MKKVISVFVLLVLSANLLMAQGWGRGNGRGRDNGYGHRNHRPVPRPLDMRIFDQDYRNFSYMRQQNLDVELRRYVQSNLLWSNQIRLLAQLYRHDYDRMDFLVYAHRVRSIYDLDQFHQCGTAFFSPRDRDGFYDFLHHQGLACGSDYAHRGRR